MTFIIHKLFQEGVQGQYGDLFWCSYENDPKKYLCKKLKTIDTSLEIELEAAHRLKFLPTVYNVKKIETVNGVKWLVSEYIENNTTLFDYKGPQHKLLLFHLLCTLQELHEKLISHNDIHSDNILITETQLDYVKYNIFGKTLHVKTFGILPIVIDFGMARIEDYQYKPDVSGIIYGNLNMVMFDPLFDLVKMLTNFKGCIRDDLYLKLITDRYFYDSLLNKIFAWYKKHAQKLWVPMTDALKSNYPLIYEKLDNNIAGPLTSFPDINTSPETIKKYMGYLESIIVHYTKEEFIKLMYIVLKSGLHEKLYNPFCYLSMLFREGVNLMLQSKPKAFMKIPTIHTIIKYIVTKYPNYVFDDEESNSDFFNDTSIAFNYIIANELLKPDLTI